jgi:hypothetical protein
MEPIPVSVGSTTVLVPRLTVQQVIELTVIEGEETRRALLADAKEAGLDPSDTMSLLKSHRETQGLSSVIVRSAFTLGGAYRIVKKAMGEMPPAFDSVDPAELSNVALQCLGVDLDALAEKGRTEGKA